MRERRLPSTENPGGVAVPAALERCAIAVHVIEVVLCRNRQYRRFYYRPDWDVARRTRAFVSDNGSGDMVVTVFGPSSTIIVGEAHEYPPLTPPQRVQDRLPSLVAAMVPAEQFVLGISFCLWTSPDEHGWRALSLEGEPRDDGSETFMFILSGRPEEYVSFAESYYEREVSLDAVRRFYSCEPISPSLVASLCPDRAFREVADEAVAVGYPLAADI